MAFLNDHILNISLLSEVDLELYFFVINGQKRVAKVTSIRGYFGHQCNLMGKSRFFISLSISMKLLLNVKFL